MVVFPSVTMCKRSFFIAVVLTILSGLLLFAASGEERVIAIKAGRVHTVAKGTIENGVILIKGGKFIAVGKELAIPEGAILIEVPHGVVTPGLIDTHSHLGLGPSGGITEDNEMTSPATPGLRIIDSLHPQGMVPHQDSYRDAISEGVTSAIVRPGSGNIIGGLSALIKLGGGTVDEMLLRFPQDMKMALGVRGGGLEGYPTTRMGAAWTVRKAMLQAQQYATQWDEYQKENKKDTIPPKVDLDNVALLKVLRGELPVHIHCGPAVDILTAVRLGEEFHFQRLSLGHATGAYKVAHELAKRGVAVVVGPQMIVYDEEREELVNLADYLLRAGVKVSIMTDADVVQQEFLRYQAGMAIKYGMEPEEALRAITIYPAQLAGVADRLGSIEEGKDADLVIFDGDPFDIMTKVLKVFINGKLVYEKGEEN